MTHGLILTDGRSGNLRQARALAQAASLGCGEITVALRPPWSWLAPRLMIAPRAAIAAEMAARMQAPWPQLAIGCGRHGAWASRWLRRASAGRCFCVQILDPGMTPAHWDLVIAPQHDGLAGPNVLTTVGSLNPVDAAWLATARADFTTFAEYARPRLALLLGGPRRGIAFDDRYADQLVEAVRARHARDGGSVLLCASPRTPAPFAAAVRRALTELPGMAWLDRTDGPNPYPGVLAFADRIVVTADSVNMLSEAAASGAPVHTLESGNLPPKFQRFHAALRQGGWLHAMDAEARPPAQPLRETGAIAAEMLKRVAKHHDTF